tara:strand:- start:93 stop:413 length:321 start_codon:yes stop_codon:yes gene_type:complete
MRIVEIFKGNKREEMYLFVDQKEGLKSVPESLIATFGTLESVMIFPLTHSEKLARVNASEVLKSIERQGYFLQMPPAPEGLAEAQISAMVKAEEELTNAQHEQPDH